MKISKACILLASVLFPYMTYADAIMPLNNIWNKNTSKSFFLAYFLIVIFEAISNKILIKNIPFLIHAKYTLIANLFSSLIGSLIVNIFFIDGLGDNKFGLSTSKIFIIFFICSIATEFPAFRFLYRKFSVSKLLLKVIVANIASYALLAMLQLSGLYYAVKSQEYETNKNKKN